MYFTSDNASGAAPEIMAALARANDGYARSYGADAIMDRLRDQIRATFQAPEAAVYRKIVPAGDYWMEVVRQGQTVRIVDLEGNQAADTLFYSAANPRERYDVQRTLRKQHSVYLSTWLPE